MSDGQQPIIKIVRRKKGHGGHHGGAWKVAYADFVTAMMAFFLVMWVLGLDQPTKNMIQDYYNDPAQFMREYRKDPAGFVKTYRGGKNPDGKGTQVVADKSVEALLRDASRKKFQETKKELQEAIDKNPQFKNLKQFVKIEVTNEGLKIELLEGHDSAFFRSGSAEVEPEARRLLALVARKLGGLGHSVAIEGHTDIVPYNGRAGYSNWELSTDRANAARRVMEKSGLGTRLVTEVRGYAATKLRDPDHPASRTNRRVSILVPFGILDTSDTEES